jgi:YVTN family beta-propeller protein
MAVRAEVVVLLDKSDHQALLLDPASFEAVAKIPTGRGPHEVAVAPDGSAAFVTDYGAWRLFQEGEKPRLEPGSTVTVLDLRSRAAKATWDLGEYKLPHGIATSRDGKRIWVTAEGAQAVIELNAATGKVVRRWKIAQHVTHMLVPTPDDRKLYVANVASGTVSVIDLVGGKVKTLATGAGAEGIDVSPDGREAWVANRAANTVSVIDTARDEIAATFPSGGKFPIRVRFTPDGKQAWVTNLNSNTISVFEAAGRKPVATIEVDAGPIGIVMSPDGTRALIACSRANRIALVDVASRAVLRTVPAGSEPDGMAWSR